MVRDRIERGILDGTDEDRSTHREANLAGWVAELSDLEAYMAPGAA